MKSFRLVLNTPKYNSRSEPIILYIYCDQKPTTMQGTDTSLNPYLAFNGNCREAMEFYRDALGGELVINTFEEAPMEIPEDYKSKVMHATLVFGNAVVMASDSMPGTEISFRNSVALSIAALTLEEGEKMFTNISRGGTIRMPFEDTFWGARFGMCTDKFGIDWMVNVELEQS